MSGSSQQRLAEQFRQQLRNIVNEVKRDSPPLAIPADTTLRVRLVSFEEAPGGRVDGDLATVELIETCDELGLDAGAEIQVQMQDHPEDANRLLHDMMAGDDMGGIPACGPGSIITFTGCSLAAGDEVVQAGGFEVVEAVEPPIGPRI